MHQVLQSGLLGQVFLLWLNLSAPIRNLLKEVRLKLSIPLITAFQEAPWQKAKVWEHRRALWLSRRSRSRDRLLFDSRSQDALQACEETQQTRSSLVLTFWRFIVLPGDRVAQWYQPATLILLNALSIIIQRFGFFHRRHGAVNEAHASPAVWDCNCNWPEQVLTYEPSVNCPPPCISQAEGSGSHSWETALSTKPG